MASSSPIFCFAKIIRKRDVGKIARLQQSVGMRMYASLKKHKTEGETETPYFTGQFRIIQFRSNIAKNRKIAMLNCSVVTKRVPN